MTRIIAGSARGRRLQSPKGEATRPTSDRVREALFSALESRLGSLSGIRFLDLYAGSGAVGLEAWSRGCQGVLLVEQARIAGEVIRSNIAMLFAHPSAQVSVAAVATRLGQGPIEPFDVVFMDPPYAQDNGEIERALTLLTERGWLGEDALVVVERSTRGARFGAPVEFVTDVVKRYGETALHFLTLRSVGSDERMRQTEPMPPQVREEDR